MDSDRESDEFDEPATYADLISDSEEEEEREEAAAFGIQPYMFEPLAPEPGEGAVGGAAAGQVGGEGGRGDANVERLENNNWCSCDGGCTPMPTLRESFCCKESDRVREKMDDYKEEFGVELALGCITAHPGFQTVCLDRWSLETAQYHYIQQYGGRARQDATPNEKSRHIAYRQFVRWCWHFLGRHVRVPLPSCAVTAIRNSFPSEVFRGFDDDEDVYV